MVTTISSNDDNVMTRAVSLVDKLKRILSARKAEFNGILPLDSDEWTTAESALQIAFPADYKALIANIGIGAWGSDPMEILSPKDIVEQVQARKEQYPHLAVPDKTLLMLPNTNEEDDEYQSAFLPFATSASAFCIGWLIPAESKSRSSNTIWPIVVLDAENEMTPNFAAPCCVPLVELLYRHVVRGVSTEFWETNVGMQTSTTNTTAYFLPSEQDAEQAEKGMTKYALDGSLDIAASTPTNTVVSGRTVFGWEEEENEEDITEELSVFHGGASEEDFLGVGAYGLVHPLDKEIQEKKRRLLAARRQAAKVSTAVEPIDKEPLLVPVVRDCDGALMSKIHLAATIRRRLAVSEGCGATILENGMLATGIPTRNTTPTLEQKLLWIASDANTLLLSERSEVFVEVAMGTCHGVALTSLGRVVTWGYNSEGQCGRTQTEKEEESPTRNNQRLNFGIVSFDAIAPTGEKGKTLHAKRVFAGECSSAALLSNGSVAYWGIGSACPVPVPSNDNSKNGNHVVPCLLPTSDDKHRVVDVSFGMGKLYILYTNGSVSVGSKEDGLCTLQDLPAPVVSMRAMGDHVLWTMADGSVYGMGGVEEGQLPVVTYSGKEPIGYKSEKSDKDENDDEINVQYVQESLETPTLLTVGPLLGKAIEELASFVKEPEEATDDEDMKEDNLGDNENDNEDEKADQEDDEQEGEEGEEENEEGDELVFDDDDNDEDENPDKTVLISKSWNTISGPFGLTPGSKSRVVNACGGWRYSLFLHEDGSLSASGEGSSLCLGIDPTTQADDNFPEDALVSIEISRTECVATVEKVGLPVAVSIREPVNETSDDEGKKEGSEDAEADGKSIVAVVSGPAGTFSVQEDGSVWGCGTSIGTDSATASLTPIQVRYSS